MPACAPAHARNCTCTLHTRAPVLAPCTGERFNLIMWCKSSSYRLTHDFLARYQQRPKDSPGSAPPDPVCLSYTHDDDYEDYLTLAPEKRAKREQARRGG